MSSGVSISPLESEVGASNFYQGTSYPQDILHAAMQEQQRGVHIIRRCLLAMMICMMYPSSSRNRKHMHIAIVLVFLSIVVLGQCSSSSASLTRSSTSTSFTKNELNEHNHVWKVMNKACFGKWSGTMQSYSVDKATNSLIHHKNDDELLNFRLWAKADTKKRDTGTWTVWNLQSKGDEFVVPLRRLPTLTSKPSQLKIGFLPGCVVRIPGTNYKEVPRAVIELGYWGNGKRRTAVLEYHTHDKDKRMELKDVTLVMQKAIPWYKSLFFVGNTTIDNDIRVLPQKATHDVEDVVKRIKARKPIRIERVELQSMERVVSSKASMTSSDKREAMMVLERLLEKSNDCSYNEVLPNGLLASFPKELLGKKRGTTFIFAHEWKNGPFQALVIDFDSTTCEAVAATMYSYK